MGAAVRGGFAPDVGGQDPPVPPMGRATQTPPDRGPSSRAAPMGRGRAAGLRSAALCQSAVAGAARKCARFAARERAQSVVAGGSAFALFAGSAALRFGL